MLTTLRIKNLALVADLTDPAQVDAALATNTRRVYFCPISIGYERIMEESAYAREISGGEKPKEDVRELARELGYVKCPVCSNVMNRKQFAPGAKTVVDVCKEHGTFFDEGELARVLDFVLQGGLTRAAEKEREAAREQRQSELSRERYLAGQHPASSFEQRHTDALRNTETFADLLLYVLLG